MKHERRSVLNTPVTIETREDGTKEIVGYAAVFYRQDDPGTEYELFPGVKERIERGAFARTIAEKRDVVATFNHDDSAVLGRLSAGTLSVGVDDRGLRYAISYNPNDPDHVRVAEKISRGDVSGSSFEFKVPRGGDSRTATSRTLKDIDLFGVGPVTYPAYQATGVHVRCDNVADTAEQYAEQAERQRHVELLNQHRRNMLDAV